MRIRRFPACVPYARRNRRDVRPQRIEKVRLSLGHCSHGTEHPSKDRSMHDVRIIRDKHSRSSGILTVKRRAGGSPDAGLQSRREPDSPW